MSLHAQLSPEAEARLENQKRNSVITSVVIAFLLCALVVLILLFILLPSLGIKQTAVRISHGEIDTDDPPQPTELSTLMQPKPSAPSSRSARATAAASCAFSR